MSSTTTITFTNKPLPEEDAFSVAIHIEPEEVSVGEVSPRNVWLVLGCVTVFLNQPNIIDTLEAALQQARRFQQR